MEKDIVDPQHRKDGFIEESRLDGKRKRIYDKLDRQTPY